MIKIINETLSFLNNYFRFDVFVKFKIFTKVKFKVKTSFFFNFKIKNIF